MTLEEQVKWLRDHGFFVGVRDPKRNTKFEGRFMVAEHLEDPNIETEDASDGTWCVVGDDLSQLVFETWSFFHDE